MKVIGIDPGYDRCGVAVVEKDAASGGKETVLYSDCITTSPKESFHERLRALGITLENVFDEHTPDALAIEALLFTNNQKTAMKVSETRGMIIYLALSRGMEVCEYTPTQVKVATTGYGGSDKKQMTAMVGKLVALPEKKRHDDEYDAIAIALTCLASRKDHFPLRA